MNGLSLFSGIGGMDLGLERAGITTVGQVEIDPWCRQVLAKHWPDVPRHDDVHTAADWWLGQERPRVDLVFGGFPCQDVSTAGRRAGIEGQQSGLWAHFAAVVRRLRPRYILVENTPGLLTNGMGRVVGDLAASGYDAEWDCIPAAAVGSPHLRARIWLLAYPCGLRDEAPEGLFAGRTVPGIRAGWLATPSIRRMADGIPGRLVQPELHGLGNAVVPHVAEHVGRLIVAADQGRAA